MKEESRTKFSEKKFGGEKWIIYGGKRALMYSTERTLSVEEAIELYNLTKAYSGSGYDNQKIPDATFEGIIGKVLSDKDSLTSEQAVKVYEVIIRGYFSVQEAVHTLGGFRFDPEDDISSSLPPLSLEEVITNVRTEFEKGLNHQIKNRYYSEKTKTYQGIKSDEVIQKLREVDAQLSDNKEFYLLAMEDALEALRVSTLNDHWKQNIAAAIQYYLKEQTK